MKIALFGYGAWGRHHADAITETPGLELAGICAQTEDSRAAARKKFPEAVCTADWRELLEIPGLEAVDIVLPTHLHRDAALAALAAGKHVLLEKPMALTPGECGDLIAAASGKILYVAHEFRLSEQWGRMHSLIEAGAIGRPLAATIDLWRRPYRLGADGWRWDAPRVGSWILEEPIHFFDLACWWLCARPLSVYARASRLPTTPEGLWDNVAALVDFDSGAHATVTQSLAVCEHHLAAKVIGSEGALITTWDGELDRTTRPATRLRHFRADALAEIPVAVSGEFFELRTEVARFLAVCRGESVLPITVQEAARAVGVSWAAEESLRAGVPVAIMR
ncbi:MAG: Gfo/Idh/MocA family protein [Bryobacteraceae bacterium]